MFPRATLTPSTKTAPCASSVTEETQSGNGRASSAPHVTSVIGASVSGSVRGKVGSSTEKASAVPSRTTWRCAGSASAALPVSGPRTSSKTSASPLRRSGRCPASVARVAPCGRQQRRSPQACNAISLWSACSVASCSGSNTIGRSRSAAASSIESGTMRSGASATRRVEARAGLRERDIGGTRGDVQPHAGIAAVVHAVVDQQRMTTQRPPQARRCEIGLGGDRVLLVAQVIADIRDQLRERHAQIRGAALAPAGDELRETVEDHASEARVVLGEVVDDRCGRRLLRAHDYRLAVELARAFDLERERDLGEARVEVRRRRVVVRNPDQAQQVSREVAVAVDANDQHMVRLGQRREQGLLRGGRLRRRRRCRGRPFDADVALALAALDTHLLRAQAGRHRLEQADEQRPLPRAARRRIAIEDLEVVDAVQRRMRVDGVAAQLVAAVVDHAHAPSRTSRLRAPRVRRIA